MQPLMLFYGPVLLVMTLPKTLATPFGVIHLIPALAAFGAMLWFHRRNSRVSNAIGMWVLLTYVLDALAWWFTKHQIPPEQSTMRWGSDTHSMYIAGFPIGGFEIPASPMGSNLPPESLWWIIYVNLAFWTVVSAAIVWFADRNNGGQIRRFLGGKDKSLWYLVTALIVNQCIIATWVLWFD